VRPASQPVTIGDHTADASERMRSVAGDIRTDFDLPIMTVNTDDGFEPALHGLRSVTPGADDEVVDALQMPLWLNIPERATRRLGGSG
jgi:hypothetical protein